MDKGVESIDYNVTVSQQHQIIFTQPPGVPAFAVARATYINLHVSCMIPEKEPTRATIPSRFLERERLCQSHTLLSLSSSAQSHFFCSTTMGEGENKAQEKKMEEKKAGGEEEKKEEPKAENVSGEKKEEKKAEEPKDTAAAAAAPAPPPPPQEIVLKVYMHCEGCARKVRRCLKGFEGVEEVQTDCRTHKVVVKGEKADPVKVLERVQKKSHRQVELISPIPKPPAPEDEKKAEEKEVAKPEEKKEEPQVITVILQVHMHCEACAQEIKRRILKMKGVENVEPDLKSSQVTVKGVFDPPELAVYIRKRTGKHAVIVKQEPEKKEEEKGKEEKKEEKKADEGG
ncbi:hypothetical protein Vadar_010557 [Vaccinium darrowii]|uniref:Uncharacterized protein n=1 Tax=Vaccinium darrowii TaxID=229202 RepID=A0ACB7YVD8_9ERIC|nr:hypothetical protein Vadar_010557 [Vaccinium darrowii]